MKRRGFLRNTILTTGLALFRSNKIFAALSRKFLVNEVIYLWSGAITSSTAKVNAKLTSDSFAVRLVASTDPALTVPVFGPLTTANPSNSRMAAMNISSLIPNTKYYYAVEADGEVDNSADAVGTFTTPPNAAFSFTFTAGSCSLNSNHPVFTRIEEKNPFFHISSGDLHYADPNSATDINVHRTPYENTLKQAAFKNLLLRVPIVYTWDDHDFSGYDSNASTVGKIHARLAYQEYVPHYPLVSSGNIPIYQAFTIGRIRFIISDLRSERIGVTMMGSVQKTWFKNECLFAKYNNLVIAWVSSVSYGGNLTDNWGGFSAERTELANFFRDNAIQNMFIICGDAHMIAIDDGTNHDFSTGANNPFKYPVFQAAALNQTGSSKGGTYNQGGSFLNPDSSFGQYGLITIDDTGSNTISVGFTGYRVTNGGFESMLTTYNFSRTILIVVPLKILSFIVKRSNDHSMSILSWTTEDEEQCEDYVIEKSTDGVSFNVLQIISCLGSTIRREYIAYDNNPTDTNHYRIKAVEKSGKFLYSSTKTLRFDPQMFLIIQSDFSNVIYVIINVKNARSAAYLVYNSLSVQLIKKEITLQKGKNKFMINSNKLSSGVYFFKLIVDSTNEITKKFIIR